MGRAVGSGEAVPWEGVADSCSCAMAFKLMGRRDERTWDEERRAKDRVLGTLADLTLVTLFPGV